ncbi:MAG TPA: GNAT family N-acetyltransferase [Cyclobacteriaceae bacterium]|nr:GNAT family N-acetyltransferase [Cyclobacteriaceae bacterium]
MPKIFREATTADIKGIFVVRYSVKENMLSESDLVDENLCESYLTERGKGWVCEMDGEIVGFAIADLKDNSIWALFIKPEYEKQDIGRQLHTIMLDWYFSKTQKTVWLGTNPNTRAELFYRKAGWKEVGTHGEDEIKFEMTFKDWRQVRQKQTT